MDVVINVYWFGCIVFFSCIGVITIVSYFANKLFKDLKGGQL
jgi:hypothetical protein